MNKNYQDHTKWNDDMIVTSRRCLFNILFQIYPLDTLLQANYYLLDIKRNSQLDQFSLQNVNIDRFGNYSVEKENPSITRYHINPGKGELDPTQFMSHLMTGTVGSIDEVHKMFVEYLKKPTTKVDVFDFLFERKPKGNRLQILVIYNEDIVENYAHTICSYLSYEFGCDIHFIDPIYRPDVKGNTTYQGNFNYIGDKARGAALINQLRDYKLMLDFNGFVLQIDGQMQAKDQMSSRLNTYTADKLLYLYNLLFPNKPLPAGNYEHEQLKQLISSMVLSSTPKNKFGNNLYTTNDLQQMLDQYEMGESEDSPKDIYDYFL